MFVKRPVAIAALSFTAMFCVHAGFMSVPGSVLTAVFLCVFAASLAVSYFAGGKVELASKYIALAAFGLAAAAMFSTYVFEPSLDRFSYLEGTETVMEGTVREELWSSFGNKCYVMEVTGVDGEEKSFNAALMTRSDLSYGDTVSSRFEIDRTFDGESGERAYYLSRGITLSASSERVIVTGRDTSLKTSVRELNAALSEKLRSEMSLPSGAVADAVILGNRSALPDPVKRDFSRIGISHLIAISGMHVSFITAALGGFLRKLRVGRKIVSVIIILTMIFYMFLTGLSPSVVRAALVCCAASLISLLGVSYDGISALSVCGVGMIVADPYIAVSPAMVLSYTACLGCYAASSLLKKVGLAERDRVRRGVLRKLGRAVLKTVIFTATVVLFTLPVNMIYFDEVSLVSLISNIVFIPLFSVILYLSAAVLILSPVTPLFKAASFVADKFISLVLKLSASLSSVRGITVSLNYPFAPYVASAVSVCALSLALVKKKYLKYSAVFLAAFIGLYAAGTSVYSSGFNGSVVVTRAGGASGDVILVSSGGKTVMCDASAGNYYSYKYGIRAMKELCVTELDAVVITEDSPHTAESVSMLADNVRLEKVYVLSGKDGALYESVRTALDGKEVCVEPIGSMPEKFILGRAEISFFGSDDGAGDFVPCFRISGGKGSAVYLGAGWSACCPEAPKIFGDSTYALIGSPGKIKDPQYGDLDLFGDCRKFAFADGKYFRGFSNVEYPDKYSAFVLNLG